MDDTLFQSAMGAARRIGHREISSRELTELLLARIDAVNPAVNAVVEIQRATALQQAAAADRAVARGEALGPLHGVPTTIKEAFHVAGLHSTWGNPAFRDFVAEADATVVRRLKQAGAIIIGTTNVALRQLRADGQPAVRRHPQPMGPDTHARRFQRRGGHRIGRRDDLPRPRLGPGGVDTHPSQLLRCLRA
jgi:amidase